MGEDDDDCERAEAKDTEESSRDIIVIRDEQHADLRKKNAKRWTQNTGDMNSLAPASDWLHI
jgi:hypothetical protein